MLHSKSSCTYILFRFICFYAKFQAKVTVFFKMSCNLSLCRIRKLICTLTNINNFTQNIACNQMNSQQSWTFSIQYFFQRQYVTLQYNSARNKFLWHPLERDTLAETAVHLVFMRILWIPRYIFQEWNRNFSSERTVLQIIISKIYVA